MILNQFHGMADSSGVGRRHRDVSDLDNLRPRGRRRGLRVPAMSVSSEAVSLIGPSTLEEAAAWPSVALGLLCCIFKTKAAEPHPSEVQLCRSRRLKRNIQCGFNINTNYSGFDCPMLALADMEKAWIDCGLSSEGQQVVQSYSACDALVLARDTLISASWEHCPRHVFGDVMDRLPASTRDEVKRLMPPADAEADISAYCYQELEDALRNPSNWPNAHSMVSYCYRHKAMCPVFPWMPSPVCEISSDEEQSPSCPSQAAATPPPALQVPGPEETMSRKCRRVMPQKCRRIRIELAGTTCKAWCPLSATGAKDRSKLRQLHPSTAPFLVWLYFVLWLQPDIVVHENSDHFDSVNELQRRIQHLYLCFAVILCPSWFGLPVRRPRTYTICFLKHTISWSGCLQEFKRMFAQEVTMRPDVFFCASKQEQERVIRQERVRFSCEETLCWTQTLSPGHLRRLDDWMRAHVALHGPCSGSICDIDHNVCMQGRSCAPGALLPPLFTHGTYWSTHWNRPLTGSEHMLAQGIGAGVYKHYPHLRTLRERDIKALAGNGMHVHVLGLLLSYIFAHVRSKTKKKYADMFVYVFYYVDDSFVVVCVVRYF